MVTLLIPGATDIVGEFGLILFISSFFVLVSSVSSAASQLLNNIYDRLKARSKLTPGPVYTPGHCTLDKKYTLSLELSSGPFLTTPIHLME